MKIWKTTIAFSFLMVVLFWYLENIRYQSYPPQVIFWITIISIISIIIYQVIKLNEFANQYVWILCEILAFSLLLRSVYVPNTGFYGYDPYHEYLVATVISKSGWTLVLSNAATLSYTVDFPILHILAITVSNISGASLFDVARWLPLFFYIPTILILFSLSSKLFSSKRVGLLTIFGYSLLYQDQMFHSLFVRESVSFVMFLATIYLYYMAVKSRKIVYVALSILSAVIAVLSHHLTPFLLGAFLVVVIFTERIVPKISRSRSEFIRKVGTLASHKAPQFQLSFVLFVIVVLFFFWTILSVSPLQLLASVFERRAFVMGGTAASLGDSLKALILVLGEIAFALVLGLMSLYGIYSRRNSHVRPSSIDISFFIWIFLMSVLAVGVWLGRVFPEGSFAVARRFESFAYPFVFMLLAAAAHVGLGKVGYKKIVGLLCVFLIAAFSIFQLYSTPAFLFGESNDPGEIKNILSVEDLATISWLNTSIGVGTDWGILSHAIFGFKSVYPYPSVGTVNATNISEFRYVVVHKYGIGGNNSITIEMQKLSQNSIVNQIYDNGALEIYSK